MCVLCFLLQVLCVKLNLWFDFIDNGLCECVYLYIYLHTMVPVCDEVFQLQGLVGNYLIICAAIC